MSDKKENRDIGLGVNKEEKSNEKFGIFNFIDNNIKKKSDQDKDALKEQGEVIDREKKTKNTSDKKILATKKETLKDLSPKERMEKLFNAFKKKINHEDSNAFSVLKTNLIQGSSTVSFDWKKNITSILISVFIAVFIICGAYVGLIIWEDKTISRGTELMDKTNKLIVKIKQAQKNVDQINIFQRKIGLVKYLIEDHVYWTNFFTFLEENTLTKAYYIDGFSGDTNGDYSFSVIIDDYEGIHDFVNVLKNNPNVLEVNTRSAMLGIDKNNRKNDLNQIQNTSFGVSIRINPLLFKQ